MKGQLYETEHSRLWIYGLHMHWENGMRRPLFIFIYKWGHVVDLIVFTGLGLLAHLGASINGEHILGPRKGSLLMCIYERCIY